MSESKKLQRKLRKCAVRIQYWATLLVNAEYWDEPFSLVRAESTFSGVRFWLEEAQNVLEEIKNRKEKKND